MEKAQSDEGGMEVKGEVRKLTSRKAGGMCGIHVAMVKGWRMYSAAAVEGTFDVAWKCEKPP